MKDLFYLPEGNALVFSLSDNWIDFEVYLSRSSWLNLAVYCLNISGILVKLKAEKTFESFAEEGLKIFTGWDIFSLFCAPNLEEILSREIRLDSFEKAWFC